MNNLNVFADAKITGGTYDNIRIFGSADISDDIVVSNMDVYGSCIFKGKSEIQTLNIFGSCDFKSYVAVKQLDIKGSCVFDSEVKVESLKVYGSVNFNKNISRANDVIIYGDVKVQLLEADKIIIKGYIDCSEQMNGESIEVSTNSGSKIKEMVGTNIIIKPNNNSLIHRIIPVQVDLIEGDSIELEYVNAKVVRGNQVKVGPHCQIDLLEYLESVEVSSESSINNTNKL